MLQKSASPNPDALYLGRFRNWQHEKSEYPSAKASTEIGVAEGILGELYQLEERSRMVGTPNRGLALTMFDSNPSRTGTSGTSSSGVSSFVASTSGASSFRASTSGDSSFGASTSGDSSFWASRSVATTSGVTSMRHRQIKGKRDQLSVGTFANWKRNKSRSMQFLKELEGWLGEETNNVQLKRRNTMVARTLAESNTISTATIRRRPTCTITSGALNSYYSNATTSGASTSGASTSLASTSGRSTCGTSTSGASTSGAITSLVSTSGASTSGASTSGSSTSGSKTSADMCLRL